MNRPASPKVFFFVLVLVVKKLEVLGIEVNTSELSGQMFFDIPSGPVGYQPMLKEAFEILGAKPAISLCKQRPELAASLDTDDLDLKAKADAREVDTRTKQCMISVSVFL